MNKEQLLNDIKETVNSNFFKVYHITPEELCEKVWGKAEEASQQIVKVFPPRCVGYMRIMSFILKGKKAMGHIKKSGYYLSYAYNFTHPEFSELGEVYIKKVEDGVFTIDEGGLL